MGLNLQAALQSSWCILYIYKLVIYLINYDNVQKYYIHERQREITINRII